MVLITFCSVDKKIHMINIQPEKTIEEAKEIYANQTGSCNSDKIKMLYNKKVLQNQDTIDSLNLKENDLIIVLSESKNKQNQIIKNEDQLPEVQPLPNHKSISPNDEFLLFNKTGKRRMNRKKLLNIKFKHSLTKTQNKKAFPSSIVSQNKKAPLSNKVSQNKNYHQRGNNFVVIVVFRNPNLSKHLQSNALNLLNSPLPFLREIEQSMRRSASQTSGQFINSVFQQLLRTPNRPNIRQFRNFTYFNKLFNHRSSRIFIPNRRIKENIFKAIRFYYLVQFHCSMFIMFASLMQMNIRN